jgi:hypothetical protein
MEQRRKRKTGASISKRAPACLLVFRPQHKYIRNGVNHQPTFGVKPLFSDAFFGASCAPSLNNE